MTEDSIARLEAALGTAVVTHGIAMRADIAEEATRFQRRFLCARLGLSNLALDAVGAADTAAELSPDFRAALAFRLQAEALRLTRLARAASAAYDVNRHICVRRMLKWIEGADACDDDLPHPSGHALNARFRRPSRARRAQGTPSHREGAPSACHPFG